MGEFALARPAVSLDRCFSRLPLKSDTIVPLAVVVMMLILGFIPMDSDGFAQAKGIVGMAAINSGR